jgi:predicted RNA-binding Zn ribbon-like protein
VEIGTRPTLAPLLGELLPVELMNTVWADRDGVHDALTGPDDTLAWLRAIQPRLESRPAAVTGWLRSTRPSGMPETTAALRELRDALRRLAAESTGDPRAVEVHDSAITSRRDALEVVDRACAAAPSWSALCWPAGERPTRAVHTAGQPGQAVVSGLAEAAVELFTGDPPAELRACLAPGCVLYFVRQHPRREWCSAGCGNRARVARHYRRHHGPT